MKKKTYWWSMINKALFLFFLFLLPTQLGKHFFFPFSYISGVRVDYLSPTLYLIDIIIFLLILFNLKTVKKFFLNKIFFYLAILFGVNISFAQSPPLALYGFLRVVELLIITALGKSLILNLGAKLILLTMSASALIQLGLSGVQFVIKSSLQGPFYYLGERLFSLGTPAIAKISYNGMEFLRPYGTFSHPNSMGGFYLLLYFFVLADKRFNKYLYLKYISLFIFSCLIFISFSKITILTFLGLNIAYVLFNNKSICRICVLSRLIVLTVISVMFIIPAGDPLSLQKRGELVMNSLGIIKNNPVFGTGLNNYLLFQSSLSSKYALFFNQPVHNIFLLFLSEAGLIGAAVLLYKLIRYISMKLTNGRWIIYAVILITGMLDHYWLTLIQNFLLMGVVFSVINSQDRV